MQVNDTDLSEMVVVPPVDGNASDQPDIQNGHQLEGTVNKDNVDFIDSLNVNFEAVEEHLEQVKDAQQAVEDINISGRVGVMAKAALESVLGELKYPSGTAIATTQEPSGVNHSAVIVAARSMVQKNISDIERVLSSITESVQASATFLGNAASEYAEASTSYLAKQKELVDKYQLSNLRDFVTEVFPRESHDLHERIGVSLRLESKDQNVQALYDLFAEISRLSLSGNGQDAWNGLVNNCQPLKMGKDIVNPETLEIFDSYEYKYDERGTYMQLIGCIGNASHTARVNVCISAATNAIAIIRSIKTEAKDGQALTLVDLQAGVDCMRHCMDVLMEARAQYHRLMSLFEFGSRLISICMEGRDSNLALFAATESKKNMFFKG